MVFVPNTTTNHGMKYTRDALLVGSHLGEECNARLFAAHFYKLYNSMYVEWLFLKINAGEQ